MACVLSDKIKNIYFCWLIEKRRHLLAHCYNNNFFSNKDNSLLSDIIKMVCTGKKPIKKEVVPINIEDLELDDYINESFDDTYNRLFNK